MNPRNRRILFSLAVLFWSAVLLYFYSSGRINKYLAPDFRIISFVGGLGLAVLGLFNLLTAGQSGSGCCAGEEGAHDHESGDMHPLTAVLLMIVPVALSVAWTKDEYSVAALSRKGLYDAPSAVSSPFLASSLPALTREGIEKSHRKTPDGFLEFSLMELFFSSGDREMQGLLEGLKVETEGRWMDEKNPQSARLAQAALSVVRHLLRRRQPGDPDRPRVRQDAAGVSGKRLGESRGDHALSVGRSESRGRMRLPLCLRNASYCIASMVNCA